MFFHSKKRKRANTSINESSGTSYHGTGAPVSLGTGTKAMGRIQEIGQPPTSLALFLV